MKLYSSATSPYGRIVRILIAEKNLDSKVDWEITKTREENSPYYQINPSGRVPYLQLDDGTGLEDSSLIARYLDELEPPVTLHAPAGPEGLEMRRLEAVARSMLDGVSLWGREYLYREEAIRSQVILAHERTRAFRLADVFEQAVEGEVFAGPLNIAQIVLACVLDRDPSKPPGFNWREGRPNLTKWVDRIAQRPSVAATAPP